MELLAVLIAAFALRTLFLVTPSTDDVVHLWNVRLRRRHGDVSSHEPIDSVIEGRRGYPTLAHWLVSFFPRRSWRAAGKLLNIAWDCCLVLLAVAATAAVCGWSGPEPAAAGLLAATSPILLPVTSRMKSMGGRTLGGFLCGLGLVGVYLAMHGHPLAGLLLAVTCGLCIVLSSKFALQFWLFALPFLALFAGSAVPLAALALTLLAALIVPGLGLREVLSFGWAHTRAYAAQWRKGTTAMARNQIGDFVRLPHYFRTNRDVFWGVIFRRSSLIVALMGFPLVWPMLHAWGQGLGETSPFFSFCLQVTAAAVAVFALVSLRPLSFLGQAERYLEYAVLFAAAGVAVAWAQGLVSDGAVLLLAALQLAVVVANFCYGMLRPLRAAFSAPSPVPVARFLSTLAERRILTAPLKLAFALSLDVDEDAGHAFYYRAVNQPGTGMAYKERDCVWFETPRPDLEHFLQTYGVDTFVVEKAFVNKAERPTGYDLARYPVLYEDDAFFVVDIALGKPAARPDEEPFRT